MPPLKDLWKEKNNPLGLKNYSFPYDQGTYKTSTAQALFKTPQAGPVAPVAPVAPVGPTKPAVTKGQVEPKLGANEYRSKFIDPNTGEYYDPAAYADMVMSSASGRGTGQVPQAAGDLLSKPGMSEGELKQNAYGLNNARNDIATGTVDPYKIASQSGIDYTPEQLAAIEKAYAGVYDPALTDVFTKLEAKQKADEAAAKAKADKEEIIFRTNESIRQWKATTGSKGGGTGEDLFTRTQLNNGAANAGMEITKFDQLDNDLKNFYINPPMELNTETNKMQPMYETFENLIAGVKAGAFDVQEATDEIMNSSLPDAVKHYFIDQLPLPQEEKEGFFARIWKAITNQ